MAKQDIKLTVGTEYNDEGLKKLDQGLKASAKKAKDATSGIQKVTSALGSLDGKAGQVASKLGGIFESFARGGVWGLAIAGITTAFSVVIDKIQKVREEGKKAAEELTEKFKNAFKFSLDKIDTDVNLRVDKMKEESYRDGRVGTASFAFNHLKNEVEQKSKQKIDDENQKYQSKINKIKSDYTQQNNEETLRADEELKSVTDSDKRKQRIEDRDSFIKSNQNMMERDLKIAEQEHLKKIDQIRIEALNKIDVASYLKNQEKGYQIKQIKNDKGEVIGTDLDVTEVTKKLKELNDEVISLQQTLDKTSAEFKKKSEDYDQIARQYEKDQKSLQQYEKNPLLYVLENDRNARDKVVNQKSWYESYRGKSMSDKELIADVQNNGLLDNNMTVVKDWLKVLLADEVKEYGIVLKNRIESARLTPVVDKDGKVSTAYKDDYRKRIDSLANLISQKTQKLTKDSNEIVATQIEFRKFRDEIKILEEKLGGVSGSANIYDEQIRIANDQKTMKDNELSRQLTDRYVEDRNREAESLKKESEKHTALLKELAKNTVYEDDSDVKRVKQIPDEQKALIRETRAVQKENNNRKKTLEEKKSELEAMKGESNEEQQKVLQERINLINNQIKLIDRQNKVEDDILVQKLKNLDLEKKRYTDSLKDKKDTARQQRELAEIDRKIQRLTAQINEANENRNLPVNQEARANNFTDWKNIQINKAKDEEKAARKQNQNFANAVGRAKQLWDRTHDRNGNVLKSANPKDLEELGKLQQFNKANADVENLTSNEQSELEKLKKMNPKLMSPWHKNRLTALSAKDENAKDVQKKNDDLKNAQKQREDMMQKQREKMVTSLQNIEDKLKSLGL